MRRRALEPAIPSGCQLRRSRGVRVWDAFTGKISFRFEGAEGTRRPDDDERLTDTYRPMVADRAVDEGDDEDMAPHRRNRLTCACFDHAQRRLMTGRPTGTFGFGTLPTA